MALESGNIFNGSKDVATAGTPEFMTAREVAGRSCFILPKAGNTGIIYIVDDTTPATKFPIPTSGITLPLDNPAVVQLDVDTDGDGVNWILV